jgi:hypothetical protein
VGDEVTGEWRAELLIMAGRGDYRVELMHGCDEYVDRMDVPDLFERDIP